MVKFCVQGATRQGANVVSRPSKEITLDVTCAPSSNAETRIQSATKSQRMIDLAIQSGAYHNSDEVIAKALSMLAEDIEDGAVSEARSHEPRSTLAEVEAELRELGKVK